MLTMIDKASPPQPPDFVHYGQHSRVADFVHDDARALKVAEALIDSGAYLIDTTLNEDEYYTWKSGVRAPCYCNCRAALSDASARQVLVEELIETAKEQFANADFVVGLATAGLPWATSIADALQLPMAYLRNQKKSHGIGSHLQGIIPEGAKVLLVDDLIASGGSLKEAIGHLEAEATVDLLGVVSVINWGFDAMRHNLDGYKFCSLTSYPQIVGTAMLRGIIRDAEIGRLLNFYANPKKGY